MPLFSMNGREKMACLAIDLTKWRCLGFHDARRLRVVPLQSTGVEGIQLPLRVSLPDIKSGRLKDWPSMNCVICP